MTHYEEEKLTGIGKKHPLSIITFVLFFLLFESQPRTIYGNAMLMMLRCERSVLTQFLRLPGLRSSFMPSELSMGKWISLSLRMCLVRIII